MSKSDIPEHIRKYPDGVRQVSDDEGRYLYLQKWLEMFRPFGYATQDDSWGELEKILDIVHRNHVLLLREKYRSELKQARIEADEAQAGIDEMNEIVAAYLIGQSGFERE